MPSILFLCKANQFRSPIAAACFKQALVKNSCPGAWKVHSAGTWAISDLHAPAEAVRAASTIGVDLSSHRTKSIVPSLLETYDLILVMESGQREALLVEFPNLRNRVYLLSEAVDAIPYDIPDMQSQQQRAQEIARELSDLINRGFLKICQLASSRSGIQPQSRTL